jgi:ATP-dependent protease ClpP protease subunit
MIVFASFAGAFHVVRRTTTYLASPPRGVPRFPNKHWHGRLPVWRSLLLNWIAVSEFSSRILESGANAISAPLVHAPLLYLVARLPFYLLSFSICVWGVVGAWRSLDRYGQRTRQRWIGYASQTAIALIVAILLFQMVFHHVRFASLHAIRVVYASLQDAEQPTRFELSSDRRRLAMLGPITFASADEFRRLLDDYPQIQTIDLSSPGGNVLSAFAIVDDVKRRRLNTNVLSRCSSACTLILLAGPERTAPADARIGFHASDSVRYGVTDSSLRTYFLDFGLSEAFVARVMKTPTTSMWYPSIETLLDERILTQATEEEDPDD